MRNALVKVSGKIKTHDLCSKNLFRKSFRLCGRSEKCGTAEEATKQYNTAHALCMVDS
jgi:hypothetical protein